MRNQPPPSCPLLQEFFYAGAQEELAKKTLLVSVWDYDLGTADDFIGELEHRCLGETLGLCQLLTSPSCRWGAAEQPGQWRAPAPLARVPGSQ